MNLAPNTHELEAGASSQHHWLPDPPRTLARHEERATMLLIGLGLLLIVGISALIPVQMEEKELTRRRHAVWSSGTELKGVITAAERGGIFGRRTIEFEYNIGGATYSGKRLIADRKTFESLSAGTETPIRVDSLDHEFAVLEHEGTPQLADQIPFGALAGCVLLIGAGVGWLGLRRWRLLRFGLEVECRLQPARIANLRLATYTYAGTTHTRRVEVPPDSGDKGVVLVDPRRPSRSIFAEPDSFVGVSAPTPLGPPPALSLQWAHVILPASIGAWVAWGVLSLTIGEAIPGWLRTAMSLFVALVLVWIGRPGSRPR